MISFNTMTSTDYLTSANQVSGNAVHRDEVSPATAYQEVHGMSETDGVLKACTDVLVS